MCHSPLLQLRLMTLPRPAKRGPLPRSPYCLRQRGREQAGDCQLLLFATGLTRPDSNLDSRSQGAVSRRNHASPRGESYTLARVATSPRASSPRARAPLHASLLGQRLTCACRTPSFLAQGQSQPCSDPGSNKDGTRDAIAVPTGWAPGACGAPSDRVLPHRAHHLGG